MRGRRFENGWGTGCGAGSPDPSAPPGDLVQDGGIGDFETFLTLSDLQCGHRVTLRSPLGQRPWCLAAASASALRLAFRPTPVEIIGARDPRQTRSLASVAPPRHNPPAMLALSLLARRLAEAHGTA